ncbi:MAG: DNA mismatch repair protein MutL, partial [Clostridia bacterium]|nr:DNA mismatch repair protein MutL [Clostridia bacterium]
DNAVVRAISPRNEALQMLLDSELVGQAFDTYILLQRGDTLTIIDQHAAHERIRYETLKKRLEANEAYSQGVLEPFIIRLSAKELDFINEKKAAFENLGFELENFGPQTIILRSIPDFYDSSFKATDFQEILDRWMSTNAPGSSISDEALFMMSCKGALKANRALSKAEIRGLVEQLADMENPFTCVHGRPVIITMDKKELEKRFKRIV